MIDSAGLNDHSLAVDHPDYNKQFLYDGLASFFSVLTPDIRFSPLYDYSVDSETGKSADWLRKNAVYQKYWIRSARRNIVDFNLTRLRHEGKLTLVIFSHDQVTGVSNTIRRKRRKDPHQLDHVNIEYDLGNHLTPIFAPQRLISRLQHLIE